MEIQNVFNPANEVKGNKPEALAEIVTQSEIHISELETTLPENIEYPCVQLPDNNDRAELSDEANSDGANQEKAVKEIEKLLQQLASWKPSVYGSAEAGLEQLKEMYLLILKQIVQITGEKLQTTLLNNLQMYMLKQLEGHVVKHFGNLEQLFRQYGDPADRAALINSLFKASVGRTLPPDRISEFLEVYSKNDAFVMHDRDTASGLGHMVKERTGAVMKNHIEGILYQKQPSNFPDSYRKAFSSERLIEADYMEGSCMADGKDAKVSETLWKNGSRNGGTYLMRDLKITEQFLEEMLGDGDLLRNKEIKACNSQIKGYLAAATWVKAELFLQTSGIQKGLISSIVQAIDKMIHTYIVAVADRECPATLTELPKNAILRRDNKELSVYNAYYQIKLLCQKERNKGEALSSGLKYAYTEFTKDKENEEPFFGQLGLGENDCKRGFIVLKENWKRFVDRLPVSNQKKKELEASFLSPWGGYVSPLNPLYNPELGSKFIIGGAIIIGLIILINILF